MCGSSSGTNIILFGYFVSISKIEIERIKKNILANDGTSSKNIEINEANQTQNKNISDKKCASIVI